MNSNGSGAGNASACRRRGPINMAGLLIRAVTLVGGLAALAAGLPWLRVIIPNWVVHGVSIAFLWAFLAVYALAAPTVLVGGIWSGAAVARAWRRRDRTAVWRRMRWLMLAASCLVSFAAMEVISEAKVRRGYRIPTLPTRFATSPDRRAPRSLLASPGGMSPEAPGTIGSAPPVENDLSVVVVGESSARGEPYHPWVSVGQIVGWQLERIFPGRKITVDVRAEGGFCLEQAVLLLEDLDRRPDAIIVFSGHNEFQTRFGWSRNVAHYVEEGPESPLGLLELARSVSPAAHLTLQTLDRTYGERPPPPRVDRELVDHPLCTPREYAFIRDDFRRRLDALTRYGQEIGALPILIIPGSNDGSFEPDRSVLAGSTPAAARAAFARAFEGARVAEGSDSAAAITAYRRLIEPHPEFAESHYRLARLLGRAGAWDEARPHFVWARDLDGFPLRCPTDFREAIRTVARRCGAMLIDGPALLARLSPHGVLDDHLFHDAHHLNLIGTIGLAQDILDQLQARGAFGWPKSTPVPRIEIEDCARHFELDAAKWKVVCERSSLFYARTAYVRYDPAERLDVVNRYDEAARAIAAGRPLPMTSPPSLAPILSILSDSKSRP